MSCHLIVTDMASARATLDTANVLMKTGFHITHTTIQIEDRALRGIEGEKRL